MDEIDKCYKGISFKFVDWVLKLFLCIIVMVVVVLL